MKLNSNYPNPIGIFDSGVGGISVLRAIREQMPAESVIYFGDQGHIPYGLRTMEQIRNFSEAITGFLLAQDAKIIVVACNTASAAALKYLRQKFPTIQFVGMEPAVKPAAEHTHTHKVGVLATPATFQGALYASVVERFAKGVELFQSTCPGLVQKIDTVVLGCTHYPFVIPFIQQIVGDNVRVIDPAPAVARQTGRLLEARGMRMPSSSKGEVKFYTSGDPAALTLLLPVLLGENGEIEKADWLNDRRIKLTQSY